jgi:hypothetical protein
MLFFMCKCLCAFLSISVSVVREMCLRPRLSVKMNNSEQCNFETNP